jgi:FHS family L-fucose permease-like MFS transporter
MGQTAKSKLQLRINWSQFPQLRNGIIAQFFYVGAQVCVSSFFIAYATKAAGISEYEATNYLGMLLLAFMLGRYVGSFLLQFIPAPSLLFWYALANLLLGAVIVFVGGKVALFAFIGVEFFMSIMYPTIFSLAVKGLEDKTEVGAAYLVMAIVGGALLPLALGKINDWTHSIQWAYLVPVLCFVPVAWFGWKNKTQHLQNTLAA